jgi:hypothetical protein
MVFVRYISVNILHKSNNYNNIIHRCVMSSRPDITIENKKETCILIRVAITAERNVR